MGNQVCVTPARADMDNICVGGEGSETRFCEFHLDGVDGVDGVDRSRQQTRILLGIGKVNFPSWASASNEETHLVGHRQSEFI